MSIVNNLHYSDPSITFPKKDLAEGEQRSEKLCLWTNPFTGTDYWTIQTKLNGEIIKTQKGKGQVPEEYLYLYTRFFLYEVHRYRWLPSDAAIEFEIKGVTLWGEKTIQTDDIRTLSINKLYMIGAVAVASIAGFVALGSKAFRR